MNFLDMTKEVLNFEPNFKHHPKYVGWECEVIDIIEVNDSFSGEIIDAQLKSEGLVIFCAVNGDTEWPDQHFIEMKVLQSEYPYFTAISFRTQHETAYLRKKIKLNQLKIEQNVKEIERITKNFKSM